MLAVVCAAVGWLYVKVFYGMRDYVFHPLPIPRHVKPALGGLLLGAMALVLPELMTGGYGWVQWGAIGMPPDLAMPGETPFTPQMGARLLLTLALFKIVSTGLTISSGGSGGVFGPSVFIGGMLGGAVGRLLRDILPGGHLLEPASFPRDWWGMGGFFAGVSKTPLASIVMVCEMTGHYKLLVPLMLVCGKYLALSRRWTLYEEQVPSPVDSPAHRGDFVVDVLERLRVGQVRFRAEGIDAVAEATPFDEVLRRGGELDRDALPSGRCRRPADGDLRAPRRPVGPCSARRHRPAGGGRRPGDPACGDRHPPRRPAHGPPTPDGG